MHKHSDLNSKLVILQFLNSIVPICEEEILLFTIHNLTIRSLALSLSNVVPHAQSLSC